MQNVTPQTPPPAEVPLSTPTIPISEFATEQVEPFAPEIGVGDVVLGMVELVGAFLLAALIGSALFSAVFIWFRKRGAITEIEARGNTHNYFRE